MDDLADPSGGWSYLETHRRQFLQANDWYGKLAMLISERLESFLLRLQTLDVIFEMRSTDILLLRNQLPNHSFCRIEVGEKKALHSTECNGRLTWF